MARIIEVTQNIVADVAVGIMLVLMITLCIISEVCNSIHSRKRG